MSEDETRDGSMADFVAGLPGFEVIPPLVRLIAQGEPVALQDLALAAGLPLTEIEQTLRDQPGTDWDATGKLLGFGLTQRPTAHRFIVSGRTLYAFCAGDALILPCILGKPALVESNCPATGRPIRIELSTEAVLSVDPPEAVVSQVHDPKLLGDLRNDVRNNVCDQGHFFASAEAASDWAKEHPDGWIVTVGDTFVESRRSCAQLGWLSTARSDS